MKNNVFRKMLVSGVLVLAPTIVNAKSANIDFDGINTTNVNDMITLTVKVNNIDDANIVALGGDIMYDPEYLTLVSTKSISDNYNFMDNKITDGNVRIAGIDYTMKNAISNDSKVYTLTFKANKAGKTTVKFENADLVDILEENIDTTTNTKTISINNIEVKEEAPVIKPVENKKVEVKEETAEVKETKVEVKEETTEVEETNDNIITSIFTSIANFFKSLFDLFK